MSFAAQGYDGCQSGHYWNGSVCSACGARLRCECGRFVRVENLDDHIATCAVLDAKYPAGEG